MSILESIKRMFAAGGDSADVHEDIVPQDLPPGHPSRPVVEREVGSEGDDPAPGPASP